MSLRDQGIVAWELLIDQDEQEVQPTAATQFATQKALEDPIAFAATTNPDILYWDQAMKAHDHDKFLEAVKVELDGHEKMGNYEPIPIEKVPKGTKLLDMVWSMRRKRRIKTQEVYKWKARLNVHGGQQEHGVHYWDTYTPVVTWQTVRFFLILSLLLGWRSRQLDFVMAYCQAPAEMPLYLRLPQGYKRKGMTRKSHVLKLKRNMYGQKQAGRVWNQYMDQGMKSIGSTPSKYEPKGGNPFDGHTKGGSQKWAKHQGHSPKSALYRFRRQQWSTGTHSPAENAPTHQTYQPSVPPFL